MALSFSGIAHAQPLKVETSLFDASTSLGQLVSSAKATVSRSVKGAGGRLRISYLATSDVDVLVFAVKEDGTPDTAHALSAQLPRSTAGEALLDLTVSPLWSSSEASYRLYAFSSQVGGVSLQDVEVVSGGWLVLVPFRQFLSVEPYQPSSYHRLQGYHALGIPLTVVFGITLLCVTVVLLFAGRRYAAPLIVAFLLLYGVRVSVDLLRWSITHASAWTSIGLYEQAGSLYTVADLLQLDRGDGDLAIFLCTDATSYPSILLRYLLYPAPVMTAISPARYPTHALVTQKLEWSDAGDVLRCGSYEIPVHKLQTFEDGSVLYRVPELQL